MSTRSFVVAREGHEYVKNCPHPIDGFLTVQSDGRLGGWWTDDHVTGQLIRDGVIERTDAPQQETPSPGPDTVFGADRRGKR